MRAGPHPRSLRSRSLSRFAVEGAIALFLTACATTPAQQVRNEFLHSWRAYEKYAWGHDELRPLSRQPRDWYGQSLLITPVDALDTMLVMHLDEEANKARKLIDDTLSFDKDIEVKNFEITIRVLGGLLSSYEMTKDPALLRLANDLGTRLLPVFDSPTGMPYMYVNLRTGKTRGARTNPAEVGTLILEFGKLSQLTGNPVFFAKSKNALVQLYQRRSPIGLVADEIDVETGQWTSTTSHVGGAIDSYYEYLLKCAILFKDAQCRAMYDDSIAAVNRYLADDALWYGEADLNSGKRTVTQFGALHAFLPGVLALGGDVTRARQLQESCLRMWNVEGIEPEVIDYSTMKVVEPAYPLRPEIIESAYVLYSLTGDPHYRDMGRTFFTSLRRYCRTGEGYTNLKSVVTKEKADLMPSYFLAETLKYLYLLFLEKGPEFDEFVFTTEAHPLTRQVQ